MKFLDSKLNISLLSVCKMCKLYQANMIYDNFLGLYYLSTVYKLCKEEVLNVHLWKWKGYLDFKKKLIPVLVWTPFITFINCGVIQGFLALRKAITTHMKKHHIFSCVLIQPISCWHVTCLWHHSVRLMNERQSLHDS